MICLLRSSLCACMAALCLAGAMPSLAAEHILLFQPNILTDEEWEYLRRREFTDEFVRSDAEHRRISFEESLRRLRQQEVEAVRVDMDEDGDQELYVLLSHYSICGSAGCSAILLERLPDGGWDSGWGDFLYAGSPTRYILRDEDRALYYFDPADPRFGRLLRKYGFPTRIFDDWMEDIRENIDLHEMFAAKDRAILARELPPEAIQKADEEMRRRIGSHWDELLATGERELRARGEWPVK